MPQTRFFSKDFHRDFGMDLQDAATFERHNRAIAEFFEALEDLPPLVVQEREGRLVVCDGTHRLEAVRRRGWLTCWAILFSDA